MFNLSWFDIGVELFTKHKKCNEGLKNLMKIWIRLNWNVSVI